MCCSELQGNTLCRCLSLRTPDAEILSLHSKHDSAENMGTGLFLSGPDCGPVLVARSRWPGPGGPVPVARSRWPGSGGPVGGPVARSRCRSRPSVLPKTRWPGGPVPVPVPAILPPALAMSCPAGPGRSRSHVCFAGLVLVAVARSVRPFAAASILSGPGGWVPVPVKRITYAVGTVIRQKQEPNGCQSQLLDMKTLDVASLAAVFLECLCSRRCLPGVCFLEPFQIIQLADFAAMIMKTTAQFGANARQTEPPMQIPHT